MHLHCFTSVFPSTCPSMESQATFPRSRIRRGRSLYLNVPFLVPRGSGPNPDCTFATPLISICSHEDPCDCHGRHACRCFDALADAARGVWRRHAASQLVRRCRRRRCVHASSKHVEKQMPRRRRWHGPTPSWQFVWLDMQRSFSPKTSY